MTFKGSFLSVATQRSHGSVRSTPGGRDSKPPDTTRLRGEKRAADESNLVRSSRPLEQLEEPGDQAAMDWAMLMSSATSEKRRIDSLMLLFVRNDRRLPNFVLKSLESSPISEPWFDALAGVSETLSFEPKLLPGLASALKDRLREHAAADNEATWAAVRRLGSLLAPDRLSELADVIDEGFSVGNRLTATQVLARTLTPITCSEPLATRLTSICEELLLGERSPAQEALLMNALAALGAMGDPRLTPLVGSLATSVGSIFRQQARTRLEGVATRLQQQGVPRQEWTPLATALETLSSAEYDGERAFR